MRLARKMHEHSPKASLTLVPRLESEAEPAIRRWALGHDLNRPSWKTVWFHAWPWAAVALMLWLGDCRGGIAFPLGMLALIGMLALRRPHPRRR
jgi:hypothetical protein